MWTLGQGIFFAQKEENQLLFATRKGKYFVYIIVLQNIYIIIEFKLKI